MTDVKIKKDNTRTYMYTPEMIRVRGYVHACTRNIQSQAEQVLSALDPAHLFLGEKTMEYESSSSDKYVPAHTICHRAIATAQLIPK